jgi:uncharacterized protein YciI
MPFIIIGRDGKDPDALNRRMAARPAHIAACDTLQAEGKALMGFALVDGKGQMNGSVMVVEFPDRAALDAWLKIEPYVTGKVWESVEVLECRTGPTFVKALEKLKAA